MFFEKPLQPVISIWRRHGQNQQRRSKTEKGHAVEWMVLCLKTAQVAFLACIHLLTRSRQDVMQQFERSRVTWFSASCFREEIPCKDNCEYNLKQTSSETCALTEEVQK